MPADEAELRVESIAAGGAGVGRLDGMAVFVPRTAPGDRVRVRLDRRRRFALGTLLEVIAPGPERVTPPCVHYERDGCGGCQLQHLEYQAQLTAKHEIVRQALGRIGRRDVDVAAVHAAPAAWHYRNKITLTLRRHGNRWRGGLRVFDAPDRLFSLGTCAIVHPEIDRAWHEVSAAMELLPAAAELRLVLRQGEAGIALLVRGGSDWPQRDAFAARCPSVTRLRHDTARGGDEAEDVASLGAFEQVNAAMAAVLADHVRDRCLAASPRTVVDAYGGTGRLARALVDAGVHVSLIEADPEATRVAAAVPHHELQVVTARVEDALPLSLPADLVVLNPPRTGVDPRVCEVLEASRPRPRRVVYISCDPATLARDVARLPSWRVTEVVPFDMFPQTAHVETVCVLDLEV